MTNIEESREYHESYQNFFGASELDWLEMCRRLSITALNDGIGI